MWRSLCCRFLIENGQFLYIRWLKVNGFRHFKNTISMIPFKFSCSGFGYHCAHSFLNCFKKFIIWATNKKNTSTIIISVRIRHIELCHAVFFVPFRTERGTRTVSRGAAGSKSRGAAGSKPRGAAGSKSRGAAGSKSWGAGLMVWKLFLEEESGGSVLLCQTLCRLISGIFLLHFICPCKVHACRDFWECLIFTKFCHQEVDFFSLFFLFACRNVVCAIIFHLYSDFFNSKFWVIEPYQLPRTVLELLVALKVVGNEKRGGSGSKLLLEYGFGPWRSMSVKFFMWPSSFLQRVSVSCL